MSSLRLALCIAALAAFASLSVPAHAQSGNQPAGNQPSAPAQATPAPPVPDQPPPTQFADPFGEELTLTPKTIIYFKGSGNWDSAFETLIDAFKLVKGYMDKEGLKPSGPFMTIYTSTDDSGFQFQAAVPVAEPPKNPPRGDIAVGTSQTGKALRFTHRGPYDSMDTTYEAITNHLDEKRIEAQDLFIEEYVTDPLTTPEDKLVIHVLVPIK
jgi:effector-binding domain-containing protein